ncbi:hypothetical protein D3C78_607980 [compost metagenome]
MRRAFTAAYQACAFFQAAGNGLQGAFVLAAVDQRAQQHALLHAVANLDLAGFLGQASQQRLVGCTLHQHAGGGRADFALVPEDAEHDPLDSLFDIAVGEDHERRFAAQLQGDVLDVLGGRLHDAAAHRHAAGEGQLVDARVRGNCCAHRGTRAGDDVQHPGWQAGFIGDTCQLQGGQRGLLGGLEDDAATSGQGRGDLPRSHQHREVPRHDGTGHPDWLLARQRTEAVVGQCHRLFALGIQLFGQVGIEVEAAGGVADVPHRFREWLAVVAYFQLGQRFLAGTDAIGDPAQAGAALGPAQAWPRPLVEGSAGCFYGDIDVIGGAGRYGGN